MRIVEWSARALRDVGSIEDFWMERDPQLISDLATATGEALDFLLTTPGAGTPFEQSGLRKWKIGRTPFLLFYRFDRHRLRITRVRHEREDWLRRN
jgi:plasmid stabilization system protein ParE